MNSPREPSSRSKENEAVPAASEEGLRKEKEKKQEITKTGGEAREKKVKLGYSRVSRRRGV